MEIPRQVRADMKKKKNDANSMNDSESSFSFSSSSSLSADLADDAISSSSSSSATSSPSRGGGGGALYQFADLMAQLPIKRGLSKYYDGKSESFGSLLSVRSVEDLAKRMKSCKSYGNNMNRRKFSAKATIAKRSPKRSSSFSTKGSNSMAAHNWF